MEKTEADTLFVLSIIATCLVRRHSFDVDAIKATAECCLLIVMFMLGLGGAISLVPRPYKFLPVVMLYVGIWIWSWGKK